MEWIGLFTILGIYICLCGLALTGRIRWLVPIIWCIPVLGLCFSYKQDMEINGLMVVICFMMYLMTVRGLWNVRMWNSRLRKNLFVLYGILYLFSFLLLYYCMAQAQLLGYFKDFQGLTGQTDSITFFAASMPYLLLSVPITRHMVDFIDRIYCRKNELIIIQCQFSVYGVPGGEGKLGKKYFVNGVSNGVQYHFKLNLRNYYMLKNEHALRLTVLKGLLGGMYVVDHPCPGYERKIRKRDRKSLKLWTVLFLLFMGAGIWIFWFKK